MARNANAAQKAVPRLVRTSRRRFMAILPLLKVRAAEARNRPVMMLSGLGKELNSFDEKVRYCADLAGVSDRTIYRWLRRFEREGLTGLREQPRKDKDTFRSFVKRGAALSLVVVEFLNGHTPACAHRKLCEVWGRLYPGSRPPSFSTLYKLHEALAPLLKSPNTRKRPQQVRASRQVER